MFFRSTALAFSLVSLISCQSPSEKADADKPNSSSISTSASKTPANDPVYQKGLALVAKSDCLTCHKIDDKLVGPSYKEIANKYAGAPNDVITALARTIIQGGSGNWGNVPMTPHPSLSQEDAESMVRYILSLN